MDDILTQLKVGLAEHLEKQGSSLEELEDALQNLNNGKGVVKTADLLGSLAALGGGAARGIGSFAARLPEMGLVSALLTGTAAGTGAYALGKHMDSQDKKVSEQQGEVDRIKSLTDRLKTDYGIR